MCGATGEQKGLEASQAKFYDTLTSEYSTVFGESQGILNTVTGHLKDIFNAGPNQRGFSDEERSNLETEVNESVAHNLDASQKVLNENLAARGGSDFIPSGSDTELRADLLSGAASQNSKLEQQITESDYATGRENYQFATQGLLSTAGLLNPAGFANSATGAGEAASKTANDIAQADNSVWGSVIGGLSGIAGQAAGGWTSGIKHH